MSSIKSLGISGIRNFAPGEENIPPRQTIKFTRPLTLISGANGTGKTTIIESLKYATTGEFPPGKGASFIHNPLLVSENSVNGFVKAEIINVQGDLLTVTRSGQCISRGSKPKFNAVSTNMSLKRKGTKEEIPMMCEKGEDVDCEMEKALGVSKAILNYVIFCHQEDSTWPLEEGGQKLKERFDQIFDSDRYNQAVESITKYKKLIKEKLSKLENEKQSLEGDLNEAIKKQKNLDEFDEQLTSHKNEVSEVSVKIDSLNEAKKELDETEIQSKKLYDEKKNKETVLRTLNKHLGELKKKIQTTYGGTTEEKENAAVNAGSMEKESEMAIVNTLASQLDLIDSKLKEANTNVDVLAESFDTNFVKKETEQEMKIPDEMESSSNKIKKEVTTLQLQSSTEAELELIETALVTKEKDIHKLRNKHEDFLKIFLKDDVLPETNLKVSLDRVQESLTDQVKELKEKLQREDRELSSLETTKKHQEQELRDKNDKLGAIQDQIAAMCHGKEYDEVLLHTKKTLQDLQNTKEIYASKIIVYKSFIEKLESCCPLCHRNYDNKQEYEQFKSELNGEVNKYPYELEMCEKKLKDQQEQYDNLLQLKPLVDQVKELEEKTVELKQKQSELAQELSKLLERIKELKSEILKSESKLAQCKNMKVSQQMIDELERDKKEVLRKMDEIRYRISKQEETNKQEMSDNKYLKEKTAEARKLQDEITKLGEELGNMNYEALVQKIKNHGKKLEDLNKKKGIALGQQNVFEGKIEVLKNYLDMDKYKFAKKNFISKCTEIKVRECAVTDLSAYTTALDGAIIEVHKERMASVNKILSDLWEIIYKGKDTTAIQIVPDVTESGENRRTFHYKVVQEKKTVNMNMKAQCSAGQKALASIIIRIALAQTFAKNCGVLTLDEPTTNLDESNMTSLAKALTQLVAARSKYQKNFQLIVISHDENFVDELSRDNGVKNFWKLSRNVKGRTEFKQEYSQLNSNANGEEESDDDNQPLA